MVSLDLSTSLTSVINISSKTTEEAFAEACGYPLTKVLLQDLSPKSEPITLPIRIVEGMEVIVDRGTAKSETQLALIAALASLIGESPLYSA